MARQPLYPHIPKGKKMALEAALLSLPGALTKRQKDAGLHLVEYGDTVELEDKAGKLLKVWPSSRVTIAEIRETADKSLAAWAEMYYCTNQDLHPHREKLQVFTYEENPKCPICGGVMTHGRYW